MVKDPQRPELEGTLHVFRFPKTLKKFIDAQTSPSIEDIFKSSVSLLMFMSIPNLAYLKNYQSVYD